MAAKILLTALSHIWSVLDTASCPRALMGGLSLSFWRHVRSTQDIDLLVDPGPNGVDTLVDRLRQADIRMKRQAGVIDLGSVRVLQTLYEPKDAFMDVQIDLLLAESAFHREALARQLPVRLPELDIDLATVSCEDLLILKMSAGRIIDRADAAALLQLNRANLDLTYLRHWVVQLALDAEWRQTWTDAFPGEEIPP